MTRKSIKPFPIGTLLVAANDRAIALVTDRRDREFFDALIVYANGSATTVIWDDLTLRDHRLWSVLYEPQ